MLVSSKEMLCKAREEGYAVGSFNIFNLESAKAIIAAAEAENAPVMLQIWSGFADFIGRMCWVPLQSVRQSGPGCRWRCIWTTAPHCPR